MATVYDQAGGAEFFERLVEGFYRRVEADPVLLALYPEPENLQPARWRLTWFLVQYFGGPADYSQERGHPRLRMRHFPFAIREAERDRWLAAMRGSLDDLACEPDLDEAVWDYFTMAAEAMRNA